ncbi:musculin [Boleophthalmus pectinirostris]|uniref:musculin n=1 Tax=Boleophthalmus pectinirostris TaxID=150288 RepID=UPI0024331C62|nr:musculin [Boleophthalmus pectinirostris]
MSTGGSDTEDYGTRHRRIATALDKSTRKGICYNRCSTQHLEEVREEHRAAKAHTHKDSRQTQRNAANARERARMRVLSKAFSRLKTSLPWVPADTKLSKLDTLRLASSYICHLRQLLQEERMDSFPHPVTLTWPFMVPGRSEDSSEVSSSGRLCGATA